MNSTATMGGAGAMQDGSGPRPANAIAARCLHGELIYLAGGVTAAAR